jgi:hypothetical protein
MATADGIGGDPLSAGEADPAPARIDNVQGVSNAE